MNEVEIIMNAQQGDTKAFEQIFSLYSKRAIQTAFLITRNQHTSEDIVQETFVKCYQKLNTLKNPDMFKSWFFKMLIRNCWRYTKKGKEQILVENIPEKSVSESIDDIVEKEENTQEMYHLISKLSQQHRTAIVLYYYNDMSIKEIAKIMGCFEGTVKSRLHNARNKLKKEIIKIQNNTNKLYEKECIQ